MSYSRFLYYKTLMLQTCLSTNSPFQENLRRAVFNRIKLSMMLSKVGFAPRGQRANGIYPESDRLECESELWNYE